MIKQLGRYALELPQTLAASFENPFPLNQPESQYSLPAIPYHQISDLEEMPVDLTKPLILLAEDDESNILTIGGYLLMHGYRLLVARDGAEALELAKAYRPNLIVIDLQMPNVDGITAIEELRTISYLADVPILALTAMVISNYRDRALAAGADLYLIKPIRLKQLLATISQLLTPLC